MRRFAPTVWIGTVALLGWTAGSLFVPARAQTPAQGATAKPAFERAPDALERVTWRTRTLVGDDRLTQWKFAVPADGVGVPTFLEAVVRADAAIVDFVEGSNTQKVSPQLQKNLDYNLTPEEIATIRGHMGPVRMLTYPVATPGGDPDARRKLFAFAKAMGVDTIVLPADAELAGLDTLADEFGVKVAVLGDAALTLRVLKALEGKSKRLGVAVDTGRWAQEGTGAREALAAVKDRLLYVRLRDRSARGSDARNVPLGRGVGNMTEFFNELNRLKLRPLALTLDTAGVVKSPADLFPAVDAFETAVQPAYGVYFTELSGSAPVRRDVVRPARGETLAAEQIKQKTDETSRRSRPRFRTRRMPRRKNRARSS